MDQHVKEVVSADVLPVQYRPLATGLAAIAAVVVWLFSGQQERLAVLLVVGVLFGLSLYHATFGFAGAYRRLLVARDSAGAQAQVVMLAVAMLLFAPVLATGSVFGDLASGAVAPLGAQVVIGALMFGVGMQLGNGCGSGTLFALGGGSTRMLFTLSTFIGGSFLASLHMAWWQSLPSAPPIVLGELLGWPTAVALQGGFLAALWFVLRRWNRVQVVTSGAITWRRCLSGPWPLLMGALALALLNFATLLIAGGPWGITWGFTLLGAKIALLFGWDPALSSFWNSGFQQDALESSIFEDVTAVMDMGLVLGSLCAAALAGKFSPTRVISRRSLMAALIGGLCMGYGSRIAFGCNVGAFFSGVASTSLHGWLWIACALPRSWIGIQLRPFFGLPKL
ncbi:YeeE/YedE family protein [Undibacterium sp. Dicai25W]|uniref:YeeE/YedE family protein n=1 Tax=Undibacterium sp. Dicai25W TaxID=3413034 RepID=UPI003BF33F8F